MVRRPTFRTFILPAITLLLALLLAGVSGCAAQDGGDTTTEPSGESVESVAESTELVVEGRGATIRIEPTSGDTVSGIVTITITEAPEGTVMAFFAMQRQGGDGEFEDGPNLGIDEDGDDGWSSRLDTTGFENGVYELSGLAMADADSDPLGGATAQIVIEN